MFPARWLDHRVERLMPICGKSCRRRSRRLRRHMGPIIPRGCSALRACLLIGDVSVREVASRLATSPRTCAGAWRPARRTDELRDRARLETACHLLENSRPPSARSPTCSAMRTPAHCHGRSAAGPRWLRGSGGREGQVPVSRPAAAVLKWPARRAASPGQADAGGQFSIVLPRRAKRCQGQAKQS